MLEVMLNDIEFEYMHQDLRKSVWLELKVSEFKK